MTILGIGLGDTARPEDVVADVETTGSDPVPRQVPSFRIVALVDVAVDDVELTGSLFQNLLRPTDVIVDPVPSPGAAEEVSGEIAVGGVTIGADDPAVRSDRPREPVCRVAETAAHFEDRTRANRAGKKLQHLANEPIDDREPALLCQRFHLQQNRLIVPACQTAHVLLDTGINRIK